MREALAKPANDELRPEYDLSQLKGGVRGKYHQQVRAGTNLVLIEPDLAQAFPGQEAVNRALRLLLSAANAAATGSRRGRAAPHRRLKRTAARRGRLAPGR